MVASAKLAPQQVMPQSSLNLLGMSLGESPLIDAVQSGQGQPAVPVSPRLLNIDAEAGRIQRTSGQIARAVAGT
jgi:hypothetical protein